MAHIIVGKLSGMDVVLLNDKVPKIWTKIRLIDKVIARLIGYKDHPNCNTAYFLDNRTLCVGHKVLDLLIQDDSWSWLVREPKKIAKIFPSGI